MMVIRMLGGALSLCCDAWLLKQSNRSEIFVHVRTIVWWRLLFIGYLASYSGEEVRIVVEGDFSAHKTIVSILMFLALFWATIINA